MEMSDLLANNVVLLNQLTLFQDTISLSCNTVNRTRLREVPSLVSWLYCFTAYVAVCTSDPLTREMLAYSRLLIQEALRHGGPGWMEYDRVFRWQLAINLAMSWNTLEPGLQAATILGQRTSTGIFCTTCQECDRSASQCALSPLQQQLCASGYTSTSYTPCKSRPPMHPEMWLHIRVNWNKGICRKQHCPFQHICAGCQQNHKTHDCPDLSLILSTS